MALFKSLSHRPFALLWSGQSVSRLGDNLYRIALTWWVVEKTGSAAAIGTLFIFSGVPMLLFLLLGGAAVDRFSRTKLMLASDLLRGLVVGLVSLLAFAGTLELWHIYLVALLFGFVSAFFFPAYTALVPEITSQEIRPSANSLTALSDQGAGILGPALGAIIVAQGGTSSAFALDALSFFISAACLLPIMGLSGSPSVTEERPSVLGQVREGIRAVFASPILWISIASFSVINVTAAGPITVALPFLVKNNLHAGVETLGLFYSMMSLGAVLAAAWLGRRRIIRWRGIGLYLTTAVWGLPAIVLGLPLPVTLLALAIFIGGAAVSAGGLMWTNILQERVPRELFGRVSSIDYLGSFVFRPVGMGATGVATDLFGAPLVFIAGGAITVGMGLLPLLHPEIRHLD